MIVQDNFKRWNDALQTKDAAAVANLYDASNLSFLPTVSPQHIKGAEDTKLYFKDFVMKNPFGTITDDSVQVPSFFRKSCSLWFSHADDLSLSNRSTTTATPTSTPACTPSSWANLAIAPLLRRVSLTCGPRSMGSGRSRIITRPLVRRRSRLAHAPVLLGERRWCVARPLRPSTSFAWPFSCSFKM